MFQPKYGTLTKASSTQVTLSDSLIKVGGMWRRTGILSLTLAGGIDTGAVAANKFYYVYVVVSGGVLSLRYSLSTVKPTGFTSYKKVGGFFVGSDSLIFHVFSFGESANKTERYVPTTQGFGSPSSTEVTFSRRVDTLSIKGRLTSGAPTPDIAEVRFPVGLMASNSFENGTSIGGRWWRETSTANVLKSGNLLYATGTTTLRFGIDEYSVTNSPVSSGGISATSIVNNGQTIFVEAHGIYVEGWSASDCDWNDY